MTDLRLQPEFAEAVRGLPGGAKRTLEVFIKYPTMRNQMFLYGYMCALKDTGGVPGPIYSVVLALIGEAKDDSTLAQSVREFLEAENG